MEFDLSGPGAIIGLGNGDPNSHEPEKGSRRRVFNGLGQIIVQSQPGKTGPMVLRAVSTGLQPASVTIDVLSAPTPPFVPIPPPSVTLGKWRLSPVSAAAPDPNQEISDNDQNSWTQIQPGKPQPLTGGNFAVLRIKFTPRATERKAGGTLTFRNLAGQAEVWMDKRLLGKKDGFQAAPLAVQFPPGEGERTVSVLLEASPGQPAGLAGPVTVEPAAAAP